MILIPCEKAAFLKLPNISSLIYLKHAQETKWLPSVKVAYSVLGFSTAHFFKGVKESLTFHKNQKIDFFWSFFFFF